MRLRNLVDRFEVRAAVREAKRLTRAARPLGRHLDLVRGPGRAAHASNPPARWDTVLEHLDRDHAMARVDSPRRFVPMRVRVTMTMIVIMRDERDYACARAMPVPVRAVLLAPRAPQHPERDADDQHGGGDLQIRLEALGVDALPQVHAAERDDPDDQRVRQRRAEAEQHGLLDGAAHGDDECGHHRLRVAGLEPVQRAEQDCGRKIDSHAFVAPCWKRSVSMVVLASSEVLRDLLELVDWLSPLPRQRADRVLEAVIEMVLDQRLLRLRDRLLDRVQLLRDVEARAAVLDHLHDAREMTVARVSAV